MDHSHAHHEHQARQGMHRAAPGPSLNRTALLATLHCLSGCAIGEVLGLVIGTALGLSTFATIGLAVALAFLFGYAFTLWPLLKHGLALRQAVRVALAADTASIAVMEIVDNGVMLAIPGAMGTSLMSPLFWGAMALSLVIAGVVAFPVNRWLIGRGQGHAIAHNHHGH